MKPLLKHPALLLLCLLALGANSCKKNRNVQGTVVDATTGEPVANAQVYLVVNGAGDTFTTYNVKKMVKTDAGGRYDFGIDANSAEGMGNLYAYHPRYLHQTDGGVYTDQNDQSLTIRLQPAAYLKLHIKNVPPIYPRSIEITMLHEVFEGEHLDTTLVCYVPGNQKFDLSWGVGDYGDSAIGFNAIIQTSHFDTTNFEIQY